MLQRAVLPDRLVELPGLILDAEYRPGQVGTYAGGDWYDAIDLGDGRIFFSVGDVMGKGPSAAALMGQVRSALRAYAVTLGDPAAAVESLDRLLDTLGEERLITALAGVIDPATGEVSMADAGHPPPLLVRREGPVEGSGGRDDPGLGVSRAGRTSCRFSLAPGDMLLCYSDGLVERRGEPITVGVERLAHEVARLRESGPDPAQGWARRLADALTSDYDTDDDVVVLALRFSGLPRGRRERAPRLELPSAAASPARARHWIGAELGDLPDDLVHTAALLTSELVSNAVLHAGTPLVVSVHQSSDRVRVDVADGSRRCRRSRPTARRGDRPRPDAVQPPGLVVGRPAGAGGQGGLVRVAPRRPRRRRATDDQPPVEVGDWPAPDEAPPPRPQPPEGADLVEIVARGIPVTAFHRASEQYDALFREFRLIVERQPRSSQALPARLLALIDELGTRFAGFSRGADAQWRQALERGERTVDLEFTLPREVGPACEHYDRLLDEADGYCRTAGLITLPASAESVALRKWFLLEFPAQAAGRPPTPWPDSPWALGLRHESRQGGAR